MSYTPLCRPTLRSRARVRLVFIVLCLAVVAGCDTVVEPGLSEADETAIRRGIDAIVSAANDRNYAAWAEVYAADAVVLPPNGSAVEGRTAIHEWLTRRPGAAEWRLVLTEIEGRDDLAFVRGGYERRSLPGDAFGPVTDVGSVVQIWRKEDDGTWKALREIFNSDAPPSASGAGDPE